MALETIVEETDSEEVVSMSENVTDGVVGEFVSAEESEVEVVNLSDPWGSDDCD